jgi:DNA-binding NarL/FixJ family response regulator
MVPIKICVIDDHPIIHDGIRFLASQTPDLEFCGGAVSGRELKALLRTTIPDVLLFDVNIDGENSFSLCRQIKDLHPSIQVLMVSAFGDVHLLQRSIRAGASGYALKSVSLSELPAAIRRIHEKGSYFSPSMSDQMIIGLGKNERNPAELTAREKEIVKLIGEGMTNVEISRELSISVHTVKFYISRLLQNANCRRRSELVKLIDPFH